MIQALSLDKSLCHLGQIMETPAMIAFMKEKFPGWNLQVAQSVSKRFDQVVASTPWVTKTEMCTAAALMYLSADEDTRKAFVEAMKLGTVRAGRRSILEESRHALTQLFKKSRVFSDSNIDRPLAEDAEGIHDGGSNSTDRKRPGRAKPNASNRASKR